MTYAIICHKLIKTALRLRNKAVVLDMREWPDGVSRRIPFSLENPRSGIDERTASK
jgi:hypothetical protein